MVRIAPLSSAPGGRCRRTFATTARSLTCARAPVEDRRASTTWNGRPSPAPTIAAAPWRCSRRWRCRSFRKRGDRDALGDFPAVAAKGVHQPGGAFDQLGRFLHFFDRFSAVRTRDDDTITTSSPAACDFVAKPFAVSIENPDHAATSAYTVAAASRDVFWMAENQSLLFVR